jgi:hypothetical protein
MGQARDFPVAGVACAASHALAGSLSVANTESSTVALPGWWQQMLSTQRREARRVIGELIATRGMMPLLMKVRNGEQWTPAEKEELLGHLRRMAHLSPYLIALAMPGSILILPAYAWWLDRRRLKRDE